MKHLRITIFLLLIAASCAKPETYPEKIVGIWQADDYTIKLEAVGEAADKQKIDVSIRWEVNSDGSITVVNDDSFTVFTSTGTWTLSEDNRTIGIDYLSGSSESWNIDKLNDKKLKVSYTDQFVTGSVTYSIKFDRQ
jgi:hypothetical protein